MRSEQSHIRDLEPLAATPLQHLFLAGNPIEDFAPLAGLPLSTLSLSALPRRARDQAVIAQLPLTELVVDALTPDTWAFIKAHPTLQAINGHQRSYVEALAESLTAALRAWIAGPETPARGKTHLRAFATRIGSREYLTLPIAFPFDEALRFCSWQGGIPASLPTSDDNELVMAYIRAYTCSEFKVYHHLGLELDARRRTCRWLSDAAYHWGNWLFPLEYAMSLSGTPCFNSSDEISGMRGWTISDDLRVRKYLVIEWAA
ncbi:MAG: hypothetical protein BWY76_02371 [bacterium ADurb.Bin429]|nr:MAG: hypothetical protein BWY76_02371 [bacterium ADurb.Bin429]